MAILQIENLPDELYYQIQSLADANHCTLNEAVIHLLNQAVQLKRPEKSASEILENIRARPRVNPIDLGLPDSTILIREDRDR